MNLLNKKNLAKFVITLIMLNTLIFVGCSNKAGNIPDQAEKGVIKLSLYIPDSREIPENTNKILCRIWNENNNICKPKDVTPGFNELEISVPPDTYNLDILTLKDTYDVRGVGRANEITVETGKYSDAVVTIEPFVYEILECPATVSSGGQATVTAKIKIPEAFKGAVMGWQKYLKYNYDSTPTSAIRYDDFYNTDIERNKDEENWITYSWTGNLPAVESTKTIYWSFSDGFSNQIYDFYSDFATAFTIPNYESESSKIQIIPHSGINVILE